MVARLSRATCDAMKPIFAKGDSRTRRKLLALRQAAQNDKAPRVALRLQALLLSVAGHTPPQIAELLQVHRSRVHAWVCNWNAQGVEGIKEGHRSGRPCELTETQRQQFQDIVDSGPVAYGLNPGVWTSPILAEVLQEEFGVAYHPGHVRKLLHIDWGVRCNVPPRAWSKPIPSNRTSGFAAPIRI